MAVKTIFDRERKKKTNPNAWLSIEEDANYYRYFFAYGIIAGELSSSKKHVVQVGTEKIQSSSELVFRAASVVLSRINI